jgi:hypothetical protein
MACLYKLSKLEFSTSLIELIGSFLSLRKFSVSVEGKMSTPREMQSGVSQGSVLYPTLFNMYINDAPQTNGVHLALFADNTCLYATDLKESFTVRKLRAISIQWRPGVSTGISKLMRIRLRGSTSPSHQPPESNLMLTGRNIPFVNSIKYLSVIFDKNIIL